MKIPNSKETLVWGQLEVLLALRGAEGQAVSLDELSRDVGMELESVRELADGLVAQGLVTFESQSDGTVVGVRLTEKGASVAEEQEEHLGKIAEITNGLSRALTQATLGPVQAIKEFVLRAQKLKQAMSEAGYEWDWLGSASLPFHHELLRITRDEGAPAAERALIEMVGEQDFLDKLATRAGEVKCVSPSADVIRDALKAHGEQRYALSIPALMPQLEGSIRRLYRDKCNVTDVEAGVDPNADRGFHDIKKVLQAIEKRGNLLFKFFITHLTENFFTKSRNPVLHGRHPNYASPELSTECVLALYELCNGFD